MYTRFGLNGNTIRAQKPKKAKKHGAEQRNRCSEGRPIDSHPRLGNERAQLARNEGSRVLRTYNSKVFGSDPKVGL